MRALLHESPFHYDPDAMATQPKEGSVAAPKFVREAGPFRVAARRDALQTVPPSRSTQFREGQEPCILEAGGLYAERAIQRGCESGEGCAAHHHRSGKTAGGKIEALWGSQRFIEPERQALAAH